MITLIIVRSHRYFCDFTGYYKIPPTFNQGFADFQKYNLCCRINNRKLKITICEICSNR